MDKPDQYGRWTVIGVSERKYYVLCRCICGVEREVVIHALRAGRSLSCGCLQRDVTRARSVIHDQSHTLLFGVWCNMRQRCTNPNSTKWDIYGGRGITICRAWGRFESFQKWALNNGYREGLQIDRRDNDGPYSPENCHWVTRAVNIRNRSNTQKLMAWGETKPTAAWPEDSRCTVTYHTIRDRLGRGWTPEDAISLPDKKHSRSLTAWGDTKYLAEWIEDERCQVGLKTVWDRLKNGWSVELALGTPSLGSGNRHLRPVS